MTYGVLFILISGLMTASALISRGSQFVLLWPALSFGLVGVAYLGMGGRIFGKQRDGSLRWANVIALLPYLLLVWSVWHLLRWVRKGQPYQNLTDGILIGRRLLPSEVPIGLATVIDLTCEFPEIRPLRRLQYRSFPLLDGMCPAVEQLRGWAQEILAAQPPVLIHCAEGHGRTGLVAAACLLERGLENTAESAIRFVRQQRPSMRLNARQQALLEAVANQIAGSRPTHGEQPS